MTREIAVAYARDNIRANCVALVLFLPTAPALFRHARKMADAATPYSDGTAGPPGRSCRAGVFLLSDEAGWQTGGVYRVDGGISAAYVH